MRRRHHRLRIAGIAVTIAGVYRVHPAQIHFRTSVLPDLLHRAGAHHRFSYRARLYHPFTMNKKILMNQAGSARQQYRTRRSGDRSSLVRYRDLTVRASMTRGMTVPRSVSRRKIRRQTSRACIEGGAMIVHRVRDRFIAEIGRQLHYGWIFFRKYVQAIRQIKRIRRTQIETKKGIRFFLFGRV